MTNESIMWVDGVSDGHFVTSFTISLYTAPWSEDFLDLSLPVRLLPLNEHSITILIPATSSLTNTPARSYLTVNLMHVARNMWPGTRSQSSQPAPSEQHVTVLPDLCKTTHVRSVRHMTDGRMDGLGGGGSELGRRLSGYFFGTF